MDTWSQDPRKYLVMHLKIRGGIQFCNSKGKIETYLPEVLEPTEIKEWQYRLMLELDGEEQFISAVKTVKNQMGNDFEASDIWTFLYWLIDKELLDKIDPTLEEVEAATELVSVPSEFVEEPTSHAWVKVPLQILTILVVCTVVMYSSYVATPIVQSYFNGDSTGDPTVTIAATDRASRMPQFAETSEMEVSGIKPQLENALNDLPVEEEPTEEFDSTTIDAALLNRLLEMRQEMAACQIRRDEHYLLNDEKGYMKAVERISELAKEIGQIRMNFEESEPATLDPPLETEIEPKATLPEASELPEAGSAQPIIDSLPAVPKIGFDLPELNTDVIR